VRQSDARIVSGTRLHGRALALARAMWLIAIAAIVGLYAMSIPAQAREMQKVCSGDCQFYQLTLTQASELPNLGLTLSSYAVYVLALNLLFFLVFVAVGVIIFVRKSDDWFGIYAALALLLFGLSFSNPLLLLAEDYPAFKVPLLLLSVFGSTLFGVFFYLFPDGRFVPCWSRWLILLVIAREVNYAFAPDSPLKYLFPVELASLILAQIYRYIRSSNAVQRQQTKWFVYGTSVGILGFGGLIIFVTEQMNNGQSASIPVTLIASEEKASRRDSSGVVPTKGDRTAEGECSARSHSHAVEPSTQVFDRHDVGIFEGEECRADPPRVAADRRNVVWT
jgi:hypothetical protein